MFALEEDEPFEFARRCLGTLVVVGDELWTLDGRMWAE